MPDHDSLLIVGHGTRDAAGRTQFHELVAEVRACRPGLIVEPGFLELAEPSIAIALDRIVERGGRRVVAAPLLLFAAGHARRDIPAAIAAAAAPYAGLEICQASHLGCEPRIIELSAQRCREAAPWLDEGPAHDTYLLFVGRGSLEPAATAEMHEFAVLRQQVAPTAEHGVCFAAMAQPTLFQGLQAAAASGRARVIVQPHLLFAGQLLDEVRSAVDRAASILPGPQWTTTEPLVGGPLLAAAVRARVEQAVFKGPD